MESSRLFPWRSMLEACRRSGGFFGIFTVDASRASIFSASELALVTRHVFSLKLSEDVKLYEYRYQHPLHLILSCLLPVLPLFFLLPTLLSRRKDRTTTRALVRTSTSTSRIQVATSLFPIPLQVLRTILVYQVPSGGRGGLTSAYSGSQLPVPGTRYCQR